MNSRDRLCTILLKIVANVDEIIDYDDIDLSVNINYREILYCLRDLYYLVDNVDQRVGRLGDRAYTLDQYSYLYSTFGLFDQDGREVRAAREHLKRVGLNYDNYVDFSQCFKADVKTFAEHHLSKIANDLLWS